MTCRVLNQFITTSGTKRAVGNKGHAMLHTCYFLKNGWTLDKKGIAILKRRR